jgi:hypothetical protein
MQRKTFQQQFLDIVAHRKNTIPLDRDFLSLFNDFLKEYGHGKVSQKRLDEIEENPNFIPEIYQYYLAFHGLDVCIDGVARRQTMKAIKNASEKAEALSIDRELLVRNGKDGPPSGVIIGMWIKAEDGRTVRLGIQDDMSQEIWVLIKKAFESHLYAKEQEIRQYIRASEKVAPNNNRSG